MNQVKYITVGNLDQYGLSEATQTIAVIHPDGNFDMDWFHSNWRECCKVAMDAIEKDEILAVEVFTEVVNLMRTLGWEVNYVDPIADVYLPSL